MFRTLKLTSFLLLSGMALDVTGAVFDIPSSAEAEAGCENCDPRIKRGKLVIKKKKIGTTIKLPPVPPSGEEWTREGPPVGGVTFAFPGGEAVAALDPVRAVSLFSGTLPEGVSLADVSVMVTLREEVAEDSPLRQDFEQPVLLDPSGQTAAGTSRLISRTRSDGGVRLRIRNENRDWDPTLISSVSLLLPTGEAVPLNNDEILARYFAPLPEGFVLDQPIEVETTLKGLDGEILQSMTRTVMPEQDEVVPVLDRARLSETRKGDARLATWTVSDGRPLSLQVQVTDDETGEVVIESVDAAPVRSVRVHADETLTFEGGEDPAGIVYLLQIDALDADGIPFGEQYEVELVMPGPEASESDFVVWGGAEARGVVGVVADEEGYSLVVTSEDDTISEFEVTFLEPFEGPAPMLDGTLAVEAVFQRWVERGAGPLPGSSTVVTTLLDQDAPVDTVVVDGIVGSGNVYSNGKGTTPLAAKVARSLSIHVDLL